MKVIGNVEGRMNAGNMMNHSNGNHSKNGEKQTMNQNIDNIDLNHKGAVKLMESMSGIKTEYIEAAGAGRKPLAQASSETEAAGKNRTGRKQKAKVPRPVFWSRLVAAAVAVSIILPNTSAQVAFAMQRIPVLGAYFQLVTFRNYSYEDSNHSADVAVSGITVDEKAMESAAGSSGVDTADGAGASPKAEAGVSAGVSSSVDAGTSSGTQVKQAAEKSAAEINQDIQATTDSLIAEFKETLKEDGYSTLDVKTETVTDNEKWYVLKLSSFTAQADGSEENRYYVISKETGERVHLADLFKEGSDYRKVISDEIIRQMKEREAADPANHYWLDEEEFPEFNFTEIAEDQQFYINSADTIVIVFQEGEVGPMSIGVQEFEIPDSVVSEIRAD